MKELEIWTLFGAAKMIPSLVSTKTPTPPGNPILCPWADPLQGPEAAIPPPFHFPPAPNSGQPPFSAEGLVSIFAEQNSGQQCKLQRQPDWPTVSTQMQWRPLPRCLGHCVCFPDPLQDWRTQCLSRQPSAVRPPWGLPQQKRAALPKGEPTS